MSNGLAANGVAANDTATNGAGPFPQRSDQLQLRGNGRLREQLQGARAPHDGELAAAELLLHDEQRPR